MLMNKQVKITELIRGDCIDVVGINGPLVVLHSGHEFTGGKNHYSLTCNGAFGRLVLWGKEDQPGWIIARRFGPLDIGAIC